MLSDLSAAVAAENAAANNAHGSDSCGGLARTLSGLTEATNDSGFGSPARPALLALSTGASGELDGAAREGVVIDFGMHAFTVGSAVLSLLRWVAELRESLPADASRDLKRTVRLSLNKGKPSREHAYPAIRAALVAALQAWRSPFVLCDVPVGCRIEASASAVAGWLRSAEADRALAVYNSRASESPKALHRDLYFQEDVVIEVRHHNRVHIILACTCYWKDD